MNRPAFLKNISVPSSDDVLAYAGLRRQPGVLGRVFTAAGLLGLGALLGAGVSLWFSSPKTRKQVTATLTNGLDLLAEKVSVDPMTSPQVES